MPPVEHLVSWHDAIRIKKASLSCNRCAACSVVVMFKSGMPLLFGSTVTLATYFFLFFFITFVTFPLGVRFRLRLAFVLWLLCLIGIGISG